MVAAVVAGAVATLIASLWWLMPMLRVHDRCSSEEADAEPTARDRVDVAS